MPTVRPSGAGDEAVGTAEKVNGGTVLHGGSNAAGVMTKNLSLADVADDFGESFGSKVVVNPGSGTIYTDRAGVSQAIAGQAGTIAYNSPATQWVMQGGNVTTKLNTLTRAERALSGASALTGSASDSNGANATRDNVTSNNNRKRIGVTDIDVYRKPSTAINGFVTRLDAGVNQNMVAPSGAGDVAAVDAEANATRAVPGELTYMFGGKNPKQDEYKSKEAPEE